jgi:type I restriction enzyme S subunit
MLKPYNEYKDTAIPWFGSIPIDWKVDKIGSLFDERRTKVSDKKYMPLTVGKMGVVPQLNTVALSADSDNRKLVKKGDFVINSRSDRKGASGLSSYDGSVSLINTVLSPRSENGKYLNYLLRCHGFVEEFYRNGRGIVADLWTTRFSEMKTIYLPIPPRPEQDQIVRFLDWKVSLINKYINAKQKQIELLREQKQAIINQAVTVKEEVQIKRFRNILSLGKGLNITKENLRDNGIPCISYGQIHSKYGFEVNPDIDELPFVEDNYLIAAPKSLLKFGDFIFADTSEDIAGSGNFTYFNSNKTAFAGYHTIIARPVVPINYRYTAYLFDSALFRSQIQKEVVGVKVFSITRSILNNTVLPFPTREKQEYIVNYLDDKCSLIKENILKTAKEIDLLAEYRVRIISDVVSGRVDVRSVAAPDKHDSLHSQINRTDSDTLPQEYIEGIYTSNKVAVTEDDIPF